MTDPKINTAGILAKKAMVVTLSTTCWGARKSDKVTTKEVTENKQAQAGAVNVTKAMIKKDALKPIREIIRKMKKYHDTCTLPWDNNGGRLLPTSMHSDYTEFFRKCNQELEDAVLDFLSEYKNHVAEATYMLGDLYLEDDYPSKAELAKKFGMDLDFGKVPEATDFRVDIPEHEQQRICRQIEERVEKQHAESMRKVWKRIYKTVEHVYDRLKDVDVIFRNTLIENVQELVDILPELNILEDKNMNDMAKELKDVLCGHDPEELRRDRAKRLSVASDSKELLDKIGAYFGDAEELDSNDPEGEIEDAA